MFSLLSDPFCSVPVRLLSFRQDNDTEIHFHIFNWIHVFSFVGSIPFCSVHYHFGHQDNNKETHLQVEFIPYMFFSLFYHSDQFHSNHNYDMETQNTIEDFCYSTDVELWWLLISDIGLRSMFCCLVYL